MTDKKMFMQWAEKENALLLQEAREGSQFHKDILDYMFMGWQASAKRDGFKLVPKKCTNNMAHAAKSVDARLSVFKYSDVWDAMLSAVEEE